MFPRYQIKKVTYRNGKYHYEVFRKDLRGWFYVVSKPSLEEAEEVVEQFISEEVESVEIVKRY